MNSSTASSTGSGSSGENSSDRLQEPELFALDLLTETPQPGQKTLARNPRTDSEMVLADEVMNAMSYLDRFMSLDEHVRGFVEDGPGSEAQAKAIASVIESVRQGGLTVSAREILSQLATIEEPGSPVQAPVVAIITCERPQALKRLLESIVDECDLSRIKRCIVVDDSRTVENQQENLRITTHFNHLAEVEIAYFGANEASHFIATLIRRLPELEEQIRFLIDRERWKDYFTVGVARNFSLLLSAGDPLIIFDDDTICKAYQSLFYTPEIEFSSRPKQAQFYPANREMSDLDTREISDPVHQHMRCLGLTLPSALNVLGKDLSGQDSLRHARPGFATTLHRHSRVLITECGTFGDPGSSNNHWLATIPIESRERLLKSETAFELALNERSCWWGVSQATIRPRAVISQVTGYDNREILPPYFPIERGEDRLFGNMVRFVFPHSVCLNYPWAIPHLPIPPRQWPRKGRNLSDSKMPKLCLITGAIRRAGSCTEKDPQPRLEHLAHSLQHFANSPNGTILAQLTEDTRQNKTNYLSLLQQTLRDSGGAPSFWTDYLQGSIQQVQGSIRHEADLSGLTPSNGRPGEPGNIEFWQAAGAEFGRSMLAWSAIRREAASMLEDRVASSA